MLCNTFGHFCYYSGLPHRGDLRFFELVWKCLLYHGLFFVWGFLLQGRPRSLSGEETWNATCIATLYRMMSDSDSASLGACICCRSPLLSSDACVTSGKCHGLMAVLEHKFATYFKLQTCIGLMVLEKSDKLRHHLKIGTPTCLSSSAWGYLSVHLIIAYEYFAKCVIK